VFVHSAEAQLSQLLFFEKKRRARKKSRSSSASHPNFTKFRLRKTRMFFRGSVHFSLQNRVT